MIDVAIQLQVEHLLARYVHSIDEDRLEEWPDFFTDTCRYQIISSENYAKKMPIGVFYANSRGMLQDRIAALRQANIYEAQCYRHIVSSTLVLGVEGRVVAAQSNFIVTRIMHNGEMALFATGRYLDRITLDGAEPRFVEKLVICDSRRIDTLLALPI